MQTDQTKNDVSKINELEKLRLPYELIMDSFAIAVSVLVLRELFFPLPEEEIRSCQTFDWAVLLAFAIDYFTRLILSEDKKTFVKKNIPELIAIIPFDNIFRVARVVRVIRLARLVKQLVKKKRPDSLNSDIKEFIKTKIDNLEDLEQEEVDELLQMINLYRGKH